MQNTFEKDLFETPDIKTSKYAVRDLTEQGVSILILSEDNHMKYCMNSESGRAALLAEVNDPDIISQVMAVWGDEPTVFPAPPPEPDIEAVRSAKLTGNSALCGRLLENEFKSEAKNDGLQPYRMNGDDQTNLSAFKVDIMFAVASGTEDKLPLFPWKNANQVKCEPNWHYSEILKLIEGFGFFKISVLKRQDEIKERILDAETVADIDAIELDYSDLLVFGGDGV